MSEAVPTKTTVKHFDRLAAALIVAAGAAVYANTLGGGWVWDDVSSVLLHQHVQNPSQILALFQEDQHAFGGGQGNFYRPLLSVSFMIDYLLTPSAAVAEGDAYSTLPALLFRLHSILWHVLAGLLFLLLLRKLKCPPFVRLAAPLLFVVHPLHTEAVAYISGRGDMMAAAFGFAFLTLALTEGLTTRAWAARGIALVCLAAALLSKESGAIFPLLLLVLLVMRWGIRRITEETPAQEKPAVQMPWYTAGAAVAVVLIYGLLRMTVLQFAEAGGTSGPGFGERLVTVLQAFALYIKLLFIPTGLHMEWSLAGAPLWLAGVGLALLTAFVAGAVIAWRRCSFHTAAGLVWFLVAWLPISGLFGLNAPMAEHWLYVPMAGFWWALGEALQQARVRRQYAWARPAVVYALVLIFAFLTVQRNIAWHDNERLLRATVEANPATIRARHNLAVTYEDILDNPAGAKRHFLALLDQYAAQKEEQGLPAEALLPQEVEVRLSLGNINMRLGDYESAIQHYGVLLSLAQDDARRPEAAAAAMGLGKAMLALGEFVQADMAFRQAVSLAPGYAAEVQALMLDGAPLETGSAA